mmetsp:Transcript_12694/g.51211  ORF Transcript_12694/g.51211 Transcript_12694/m.51211 type:complete len:471 (-) Transcript_12694:406-1818(-)|eukprot:CAMPEP_0113959894 /NCGR_PEP_ID=MMETSP0011_2-20120614/4403_1 /TAXON_ID=101924 /ORGANISM="Rhodosorus marinus" /LENGTH=470 /DNA_ID=CAMNT_0000971267 /DNA_START=722 /DNA_END=2134 /DNA_ORIENTATION=- /assembly_acc=CAM_ASM_000156
MDISARRMDTVARRMDSLVGEHIAGLCKRLEWDSIPLNWMLFRIQRATIPYPTEPNVLLVNSRITVPELTGQALARSEIARMVSWITQPSLVMIEAEEDGYTLGSGWAFLGGLPELEGQVNRMYSGVRRIRMMTMIDKDKGVVLLSGEVRPGLVAVLRMMEVDGRHNVSTWTVVDKETQLVLASQTFFDRRWCEMCLLTGAVCDPRVCYNEVSLEKMRAPRISVLAKMERQVCNIEYLVTWLSGKWTMPLGPLEPLTADWRGILTGISLQYALASVLQIETEIVSPPRSCVRLVKLAQDEMDYFLTLEEPDGAELDAKELATVDNSAGLQATKKMKREAKRHRCEICGSMFKRSYDMKRHRIAVHEKRRDFACKHCTRTFTQSGHLHEHIRVRHTGVNLFTCPTCEKTFGSNSKMERHARTVHSETRDHACGLCNIKFKARQYLRKHLLSKHEVNTDDMETLSRLSLRKH